MKPVIRRFHSPDVFNLQSYVPENPEEFGFLLQLMIGHEGEEGTEAFDVVVCTPKWLLSKHKKDEVLIGRHYLIVFEYDFARIADKLNAFCETCEGVTWPEVAQKLARLGRWEFEDYNMS